jgi:hypothetical protein
MKLEEETVRGYLMKNKNLVITSLILIPIVILLSAIPSMKPKDQDLYVFLLRGRDLFIKFILIIALIISACLKLSGVLEGFGDLTQNNIGPINSYTEIKRGTWLGIKDEVLRIRSSPDMQKDLSKNWSKLISEQEGLYYAQHGKFPYPEAIINCVLEQKEKEEKKKRGVWNKRKIRKTLDELEIYERTLPVRSFVQLAQYQDNPCIEKVPELKFLRELHDTGINTVNRKKLFCNNFGLENELEAYNVADMNGREVKSNPHMVNVSELPKLLSNFSFLEKPCNPCNNMKTCKFALNGESSQTAVKWWGLESASNSQIIR